MFRTILLSMYLLAVMTSCASMQFKEIASPEGENDFISASLTTFKGEVIYRFTQSELGILREILDPVESSDSFPVTSPAWEAYLRLTFATGKTENYLIYSMEIIQDIDKNKSPRIYSLANDPFWLWDKAKDILGEESKEYQSPKGMTKD